MFYAIGSSAATRANGHLPGRLSITCIHVCTVRGVRMHERTKRSIVLHALKKYGSFPRVAVSSLRRGHANLLCIVPILTDVHE